MDCPLPGLLNDRSRPSPLSQLPKEIHQQAHVALVGCQVRGFLFRRLWSQNSQAQGKRIHKDCVHLLFTSPSEDYFKHKASEPCSEWETEKRKQAGYIFNIVLQLIQTAQLVEPQFWTQDPSSPAQISHLAPCQPLSRKCQVHFTNGKVGSTEGQMRTLLSPLLITETAEADVCLHVPGPSWAFHLLTSQPPRKVGSYSAQILQ